MVLSFGMESSAAKRIGVYGPWQDAADHLRRKRAAAGGQVRTASEFIEQIASKSSVSGKEYDIRLPDGNIVRARDFLFEELAKLQTSQ